MSNQLSTDTVETVSYFVHWDMGTYGPYDTYEAARAFQQSNRMAGSAIDTYED